MPLTPEISPRTRPSFGLSLLICAALVALMAYLRLHLIRHEMVPLTYAVPLLICLWNRYRPLLYGMAVVFTGMTLLKCFVLLPVETFGSAEYRLWAALMQLVNIWLFVGVLHLVIRHRERIEATSARLAESNQELQASNEELAAREEEITRQNEELQSQAEELEQQSEKLRQQTEEQQQQNEELVRQGEELQVVNEELARRERALQTLLDSARLLSGGISEALMGQICEACMAAMADTTSAAAIVEVRGDQLAVRGHTGFGPDGPTKRDWSVEQSFAQLSTETGRTAYVSDTLLRPDLEMPQPAEGSGRSRLRSILISPLRLKGRIVGAVEAYSEQPREWTEADFQVIEWLAAAASIVMEAAELQHELEDRRREAEESSVRKTRFLAAVSHDVRTPANAINLLAELIEQSTTDSDLAAELPDLTRDLRSCARNLVDLVTDVLDLARMDSAQPELNISEFELWPLIEAEMRQQGPLAEKKGLALSAEVPPNLPWLRTDKVKLARVLSNLVGNALKFTERGSIGISASHRPDGSLELHVSDTGIGIAPEHLPCLFDEFYQLRNPERDRSKGSGLGLAICQRLARVLGCTITVESRLHEGSTFTLRVPASMLVERGRSERLPPSAPVASCSDARKPLEGLRILLVEDHDVTRQVVARLLNARGAVVTETPDARGAVDLLSSDSHQVLLLDMMLPDMDGREVLRHLQKQSAKALRCVLAVTGDASPARREEVMALGADELIPKPVSVDRLTATIRRLLGSGAVAS